MIDKKTSMTISEYITSFPEDIQAILEKIRQTIHRTVPEATESISYGIPTFTLNGKHLIFFAGWKHHISLYPIPAGDKDFQQTILRYKKTTGTIQFSLDKPIPYDIVVKLVILLKKEKSEKEHNQ